MGISNSLRDRLLAFCLVGVELALVLLFVRQFEIEDQKHLFPMFCLAAGGFLVHAWLPRRLRLRFFAALSLGGLLFILGGLEGAKVIGIGLGLIALCHLPVPWLLRVAVVAIAGGLLAGLRMDYPLAPFWPVLASMFMFRVILYLFELRHTRPGWPSAFTLAYFFPLPNIPFSLFPVLDFRTFQETYYDDDEYTIYQTGIVWIVRGFSHLLAFRVVRYYLLPAPYQLTDGLHVALYLAGTYALYLHVSGWFHIVTGLLHLFGFNVPRTHHNYFLASSVSDIWRRINIYWKDFMTKVFFFPAFFALRRFGTRPAMIGATLGVFLATWLLHAYQIFWIRGNLDLGIGDAGLWLGAGAVVALSLQLDLKSRGQGSEGERQKAKGKRQKAEGRGQDSSSFILHPSSFPNPSSFAVWPAAVLSLRVLGTFTLISLWWGCWADENILKFFKSMWLPEQAVRQLAVGAAWMAGIAAGVVAVGVLAQWLHDRWRRDGLTTLLDSFPRSVAMQSAVLGLALVASLPPVAGLFGASAQEVAVTLRQDRPTFLEAGQAMRGYYEEIALAQVHAGPFLTKLTLGDQAPPEFGRYAGATRKSDDPLLGPELIPGWRGNLMGAHATVNRLGMRDREGITLAKPANTCRIALVGSSVIMGVGVEDNGVFKVLVEDQLNATVPPGRPRFELLNFGQGRSMSINRVRLVETKVLGFEPDAIYYFAHQDELYSAGQFMAGIVSLKVPLPYPYMEDVVRKAGITADTPPEALERLLMPHGKEITLGLYRVLVDLCKKRGILPVWVYLPMPGIARTPADAAEVVKVAKEAGFVVVNLADWAKDYQPAAVKLGSEDHHPNALGHRLIAERLLAELKKRPELLPASARLRP